MILQGPVIRKALAADLALLAAVERSAASLFAGTATAWLARAAPLPGLVLEEAAAQGLLWVAWRAEHGAVGFLLASRLERDLFIEELSVARPHQGQGFGRALLAHAVGEARECGAGGLSLTTDHDLPWNAPFYASAGFRVLSGEAVTPLLRHRLRQEAAHGFDPARRCAMRLALRG